MVYEKSVELSSLVPRIEALVMPITVRTSNAEAHACMYIKPLAYLIYNKVHRGLVHIHTHEHLPLPCPLTVSEIYQISMRQEQSVK